MYTIKLFHDPSGSVECYGATQFSFSPAVTSDLLGCIDTHDGRDDLVIGPDHRCYVVNAAGKTVFKVTKFGAN